jgi:hypothetical protein
MKTVILDDNRFEQCTIEDCHVIYRGGDTGIINTKFNRNVFKFEGVTAEMFERFNLSQIIPPTTFPATCTSHLTTAHVPISSQRLHTMIF